ncbi:MAG: hypothetical protein ACK50A_02350 [Sphingobacteriaceae bacterium]
MKKVLYVFLIIFLTSCSSWTKYWPYLSIPPKNVRTPEPKNIEHCLTILDNALKPESKLNFKNEDSSIAVINIIEGQGGIGYFFLGSWNLDYYYKKDALGPIYPYDFPTQVPFIVKQFDDMGVSDANAMIRIIFSCFHKKLNNIPYSEKTEIQKIKQYWVNHADKSPETSVQMRNREDSIINAFAFNNTTIGDTVVCWFRQPPKIINQEPSSYYVTSVVEKKNTDLKNMTLRIKDIVTDKNTKELIFPDKSKYFIGDTLVEYPIDWHLKRLKYFNYNRNTYWP